MTRMAAIGVLCLLAGCGAQGAPIPPGAADDRAAVPAAPVADVGVGVGPDGLTPRVTVADGIGRVTLGPGGLRLGAAGIPLGLGF